MQPEEWIIEGEVGTSSKTIWAVMMGLIKEPQQCDNWHYDTPHDSDDFSRCTKLLHLFPDWRKRIGEVGDKFPKWTPFCREWAKLETMYIQHVSDIEKYQRERVNSKYTRLHKKKPQFKDFDSTNMYDFMQKLNDEGMLLDGWIQDSPSSWHRPNKDKV